MTLHRFFVERPLSTGDEGSLGGSQARKISRVLRLAAGDEIALFDGSGREARAEITASRRDEVGVRVASLDRPDREPSIRVTVGLGLLRGDRFDLAVQKLTEAGVARIVPLGAERSVVSYPDARDWAKRGARLRRIAVEAAEQSERVTIPDIAEPRSLSDFLEAEPVYTLVERQAGESLDSLSLTDHVSIAVGPEGGWSAQELDIIAARAAGGLGLGGLILRAETAAIIAAGVIIQRWWADNRKGPE